MFEDLLEELQDGDFEEIPVDIEEFVTSPDYLNLPTPLSEYQYQLIKVSTQIYRKESLIEIYGEEKGLKRWSQTYKEVIFQLGKGSGKDFTSTIACAYLVYLLLCLKDPAHYFGKPPGDNIDILNVATNATQAANVFFAGFVNRITRSPWFVNKYRPKQGVYNFDKNINVYSGHSEREGWEGYNLIYVVLDEISGFATNVNTGNDQANTAAATYKMYKQSLTSRFPDVGKLVLLSFPRYKNDYIQQRYNYATRGKNNTGQVETIIRSHTFKIDKELPDGIDGNEFTIQWEEDHIIRYGTPNVYALKRPSWEVNPTRDIEDYLEAFLDDPVDSLGRFACMPPEAEDAFFKSREKIEHAFSSSNALDESNRFYDDFKPDPDAVYFVHVDLAQKHDRCAVALAHVSKFVTRDIKGGRNNEPAPFVKVDAVRWWTPTSEKSVDFTEVREYILTLQSMGFNIRLVTFDRWNSHDLSQELREYGLRVDTLSVAKKHYTDMAMVVHEERLEGPDIGILIDELLQLKVTRTDKIDHPTKGSKDLSDATCGAIYNAIAGTPRGDREIEVITDLTVRKGWAESLPEPTDSGVIRAPKRSSFYEDEDIDDDLKPPSLAEYLSKIRVV
jgi:hypothetical protein